MRNRRGKANTSSQYKGVRLINGKWRGVIMDGRRAIHLGHYKSEEYAAKIYDAAAWILFGASAHYNFPIGTPSRQHRQTAKNYIERHLNKRRAKKLMENELKALIERQLNISREKELMENEKKPPVLMQRNRNHDNQE